jgi:type IV pilus assembly protein PilE
MRHLMHPRRARGFTLIETLFALAVAGILSSLAYPSYLHVIQRVRRADALVAVMQVQMAQERHRADHARYGSLADLRMNAASPGGHYTLTVEETSSTGYELHAEARGPQGGDRSCRHLRLVVDGAQVSQASGPDEQVANGPADNRKCWGL